MIIAFQYVYIYTVYHRKRLARAAREFYQKRRISNVRRDSPHRLLLFIGSRCSWQVLRAAQSLRNHVAKSDSEALEPSEAVQSAIGVETPFEKACASRFFCSKLRRAVKAQA